MIIELMLLLIAIGAGIVFVAWTNTRRRNREAQERVEVSESTGKLKQELERTANEIIGRMENHISHLENVLDESERNRAQLEGRVTELKNLLKKSEGQSGEIRDLLARLDDAGSEVDAMQRKMNVVERKINLAMTTPIPQPVQVPQIPITPVAPITPAQIIQPPVTPIKPPSPQITTPPPQPINPLGPIAVPQITRTAPPKVEPPKPIVEPQKNDFDKILEESLSAPPTTSENSKPRSSIVLSPSTKQPVKAVESTPVKIETTRQKLTEASAKMAEASDEQSDETQAQALRRKRAKNSRTRDVRKAALDAIREAEELSDDNKIVREPKKKSSPEKILPERRDLKLETTDTSVIKEMLLAGMSIEDIARETGLGRNAIELVQEMTRRQLDRR